MAYLTYPFFFLIFVRKSDQMVILRLVSRKFRDFAKEKKIHSIFYYKSKYTYKCHTLTIKNDFECCYKVMSLDLRKTSKLELGVLVCHCNSQILLLYISSIWRPPTKRFTCFFLETCVIAGLKSFRKTSHGEHLLHLFLVSRISKWDQY